MILHKGWNFVNTNFQTDFTFTQRIKLGNLEDLL